MAKLHTSPEAAQLQVLLLEMKHLQWQSQNWARRDLETGYVLHLVDKARNTLNSYALLPSGDLIDLSPDLSKDPATPNKLSASKEHVETTLERLANKARTDSGRDSRDALFTLLVALHTAAAARARGDLPEKLAELRDTQEEARYSILRSGARVSADEALIRNAVARLALYYQGGIKPAQLAQLLYNLSGLVSLPLIAAK